MVGAAGPLYLLPPSETKTAGGSGSFEAASGRFAHLGPQRATVAVALAAAMDDSASIATITGLRPGRAAVAAEANRSVLGAPTLPAGSRYTGVVWSHLEVSSLSARERRRAGGIVVVSALGGLFAFDDPVPDYKLAIGARLGAMGPLARFWRAAATDALAGVSAGRPVFDLLADEHRRAVDLAALPAGATVRVEFRAATGTRAAGHRAKAAKGCFVRHLLEAADPGVGAAEGFSWEGWRSELHAPDLVVVRAPG